MELLSFKFTILGTGISFKIIFDPETKYGQKPQPPKAAIDSTKTGGKLTGEDLMTIGKYKNKRLSETPSFYLAQLLKTTPIDEPLRSYINNRLKVEGFTGECKKTPYSSKMAADYAVVESAKVPGAPNLASYKCPQCHNWHVTKNGVKQYQFGNNE